MAKKFQLANYNKKIEIEANSQTMHTCQSGADLP
jgi:hypothetical protein